MVWHILKKDLRRLAIPIVLIWCAATVLAIVDSLHFGVRVAPVEAVLKMMLPLGWAALMAMAVQQEPLTTDTAFWLTRPYRRGSLVVAKLLFAAVAIHIPLCLYLAAVQWAHGISPVVSTILEKQLLVLLAVTTPVLALATITNTGLALGASVSVAAGLTALLETVMAGPRFAWVFGESVPLLLGLLVLTLGSIGLVGWQYKSRTRWAGRTMAVAVAVSAVVTSASLPGDVAAAVECALANDGDPSWAITFDSGRQWRDDLAFVAPPEAVIALPLQVSGVQTAAGMWVEQLSLRLSGSGGREWSARRPRHGEWAARIRTLGSDNTSLYQTLRPDPDFLSAVGQDNVRIEGRASVRPFTTGIATELSVPAYHVPVPGLGVCSAEEVTLVLGRAAVAVTCESAHPVGASTEVTLLVAGSGRSTTDSLGYSRMSGTDLAGLAWLSPLDRRHTLLESSGLKRESPKNLKVRITPAIPLGCANVTYAFDMGALSRWRVHR